MFKRAFAGVPVNARVRRSTGVCAKDSIGFRVFRAFEFSAVFGDFTVPQH